MVACGLTKLFSERNPMRALIVIDMLNDFVDGVLANEEEARSIVPSIRSLLDHAREHDDWVVVFSNDAHESDDPELPIWGPHAMRDTPGAQVIDDLAPRPGPREIISPKRGYGAFDEDTGLAELLDALGVDEVVLTGQHTHCCVRHSAYGAFQHGYRVTVPADATCVFAGVDKADALDYLATIYGATITTTDEVLAPVSAR
jgi:nicotinamidase-related amidase